MPKDSESNAGSDESPKKYSVGGLLNICRDYWLLGDKLLSTPFQDASIDALIKVIDKYRQYQADMHEIVYAKTAGPNALRRLLVDTAVWTWQDDVYNGQRVDAAWMEFFRDLALRLNGVAKGRREKTAPFYMGPCEYHEHGKEQPCYKTMFR